MMSGADHTVVKEANRRFYEALEHLDLLAMERVWLHEDWVKCIHPGWEMITGWHNIRRSWAQIFDHTRAMRIILTDISVHVIGDVGWVTCLENITAYHDEGMSPGLAQATNIFLRRQGEWFLVHHHASPVASELSSEVTGAIVQ
ncbi:MAG TPA: nuclear transport factor 2 family protein [Blastocatellia bacterium]|nr:nuclear transport factor 2 family protein [Blastocatellia bacterium]